MLRWPKQPCKLFPTVKYAMGNGSLPRLSQMFTITQ